MKKRLLALLMALALMISLMPATAFAAGPVLRGTSDIHSNPLYPDSGADRSPRFTGGTFSPAGTSASHFGTVLEVAEDIREHMTARTESFTVYLQYTAADGEDVPEGINRTSEEAFDLALEHTGVPVEGDYLKWHWGQWTTQWQASFSNNTYNVTIDYAVTYYTTAAQEAELDLAVEALLEELDLEGESDYRKVLGIYDYLCENVTYDHENLNDQNHKLKFTAYAALMDGTAVCQGYATLFYRLALTLGVDARLIPGDGGGPHAWNIARLNDLYYNLDATWDAGVTEYRYFLVSPEHFTDHTRYPEYDTDAFHAAYPMSPTDFDPDTDIPHTHSYTAVITEPTCTSEGFTTHTCSCGDSYTDSVISQLGHRWDEGTVMQEPTETESGLMVYTCIVCGETDSKIIPSLDHEHSYEATVIAPTCTESGYTIHICTGCGDRYTDTPVPATGHSEVTDAAVSHTCTGTGLTEGSHCGVCGLILIPQESIPATGHSFGPWYQVSEPTSQTRGLEVRQCACGAEEERLLPVLQNPFRDVKPADYFFEPVLWAVYRGITTGMSDTSFGPGNPCTRAQVVTFLWRAAGEPAPASAHNPFTDVKKSDYFYNAVLWAVEKGITTGMSATTFGPNSPCTRGQVVTFLHRSEGTPVPESGGNGFSDVSSDAFYRDAVLWAVEEGITTGTGNGKFSPNQACTRAQVVTFLHRANH